MDLTVLLFPLEFYIQPIGLRQYPSYRVSTAISQQALNEKNHQQEYFLTLFPHEKHFPHADT